MTQLPQHDYSLRLTAPFRCHFNLHNPRVASYKRDYQHFLRDLKNETRHPTKQLLQGFPLYMHVDINIPDEASGEAKFVSMDENSTSYISPEIFTVSFNTSLFNDADDIFHKAATEASSKCNIETIDEHIFPNYDSLKIHIYDNTIAILSLEIDFSFEPGSPYWSHLDAWTTYFTESLCKTFYKLYIWPLLCKIFAFSTARERSFVLTPDHYYVFLDMEIPEELLSIEDPKTNTPPCTMLWVSRTLIFTSKDHDVLSKWIERALCPEDERIPCDDAWAHLGWGNNLVDLPCKGFDRNFLAPVWEGSHMSQYYYAAADVVSHNLSGFIGTTYSKQSNKNIREVSANMEAVLSSVMILQVAHLDAAGLMQGTSRVIFNRFEQQWDFNGLLENVQTKVDLCKSNVDQLYRVKNQRNQARSELVLTSLAGLGVVNLAVAISGLAYTLKGTDDGKSEDVLPGIIDLGQSLSANTMGWIGIALAVIAVLIINKNSSAG